MQQRSLPSTRAHISHNPRRSCTRLFVLAEAAPATTAIATASTNGANGSNAGYYKSSERRSSKQRDVRDQRPSFRTIQPRGSVAGVVLGGAESDSRRLFPLTEKRTLPAIPLAGIHRLIDVPLSNLLNSDINKVYVLTQYQSSSLNRYLHQSYDISSGGMPLGGDGFIEVVAAAQGPQEKRWAEGSADAVRQWLAMFNGASAGRFIEDILILPSDQVYKMDFTQLVEFHRQTNADLTIVARTVEECMVDHVGCIKLGPGATVMSFEEKPQDAERKSLMSMDYEDLVEFNAEPQVSSIPYTEPNSRGRVWVGSCGIYCFRKEALQKLLGDNKKARDFSREVIPEAIRSGMKVMAYNFPEFWRDIGGSIGEFYDFNIALAKDQVPFSFQDAHAPFFGSAHKLPPSVMDDCIIKSSIIGSGCTLSNSTITNSVIGSRAVIGEGCKISDSVIMGGDYYEAEKEWGRTTSKNYPHMGIGAGSHIHKAIVDKNARIGQGVMLLNKEGVHESMDRISKGIAIRDGLIVISKSAVVPDGTVV